MSIPIQPGKPRNSWRVEVRNWLDAHPTTLKIIHIGIGLLCLTAWSTLPFTIVPCFGIAIGSVIGSSVVACSALALHLACPRRLRGIRQDPPSAPTPMSPEEQLWQTIAQETDKMRLTLDETEIHTEDRKWLFSAYSLYNRDTAVYVGKKYPLHANRVGVRQTEKYRFIASQFPNSPNLPMFWQAIFDQASVIIDLTHPDQTVCGEPRKNMLYYPDLSAPEKQYGTICVKCTDKKKNIDTYDVTNLETGEKKVILRYHYMDWQDGTAITLPQLKDLVDDVDGMSDNRSFWVHCLAGIGRTGTLITALILKEKLQNNDGYNKKSLGNLIKDIICDCRKDRWLGQGKQFVAEKAQSDLLLQYGHHLLAFDK